MQTTDSGTLTTDTAENYLVTPGSVPDPVGPPVHTFQGRKLFPYSTGTSLLHASLCPSTMDTGGWLAGLTFLLVDLQTAFDTHKSAKCDDQEAEELAYVQLLATNDASAHGFEAKVFARAARLSRPEMREAVDLATAILRDYQAAGGMGEAETSPEASEPATVVVAPPAQANAPAGKRQAKVGAKRKEGR